MGTRTGKTATAFEVMMDQWHRGRRHFLVVAPNNVTGNWMDEAADCQVPLRFVRFTPSMSRDMRIRIVKGMQWDVLVVNWDAVRIVEQALVDCPFEGLYLDEIQRAKNRNAQRTMAVRNVAEAVKRRQGIRLGLSGTPVTKNPLDLWSIFDVLDPYPPDQVPERHQLGYGEFRAFEFHVSIKQAHPRIRGHYLWEFPEEAMKELSRRVAFHSFEAFKEDVMPWLPPQRFQKLMLDMLPEQKKLYDLLRDESVAFLTTGAFDNNRLKKEGIQSISEWVEEHAKKDKEIATLVTAQVISAKMQVVLLTRLHQIACGHIKLDDGSVKRFKGAKEDYLVEYIPELTDVDQDNKLIIFTAYREDVKIAMEAARSAGVKYVSITGDNSGYAQDARNQFTKDPETRVIICNLDAGSSGIDLSAANFIIYYSYSYNWEHRKQSIDRAHGPRQLRPTLYTDLLCRDTMERGVLNKLENTSRLVAMTRAEFGRLLAGME